MFRDLFERVRYSAVVFLIAIVIVLSFFSIAQEKINEDTKIDNQVANEEVEGSSLTFEEDEKILDVAEENAVIEQDDSVLINIDNINNYSLDEEENFSLDTNDQSIEDNKTRNAEESKDDLEQKETDYEYIDIKNISEDQNEPENEVKEESEVDEEDKMKGIVSFKGGKIIYELEIEESKFEETRSILDHLKINETNTTEDGEYKKEVKLSSEDHLDNEFTYYSEIIEIENLKEKDIKIYWEENETFIDVSESFDNNENGLIDRISWIVPHLSNQTFIIMINLNKIESTNATAILLDVLSAPFGNVNKTEVYFNFSVVYYNSSLVVCNFNLEKEGSIIKSENFSIDSIYGWNLENGNYSWETLCNDINNDSIRNSTIRNFTINFDYTPIIEFNVDKTTIALGEIVNFTVNVSALVNSSINYTLFYGDVGIYAFFNENKKNVFDIRQHQYGNQGTFNVILKVYFEGSNIPIERTKSILVNAQNETEKPKIYLLEPSDNENINGDNLNLSYRAYDNTNLSNCTLSIFYYNNSQIGTLVYSNINITIKNNDTVNISLEDFDDGEHSWDVGCYDVFGNYREENRDFEINLDDVETLESSNSANQEALNKIVELNASYEGKEEVESAIDKINDFFIKYDKFSLEEKEAIEDLGIKDNLDFKKKRLLQVKVDLEHNIDYIGTEQARNNRREEVLREIENITNQIPENVRVIKSKEYYKNSLEFDFENIINAYVVFNKLTLSNKQKEIISSNNERIQKDIIISAKAKQLELEYDENIDKITLVSKNIEIKNDSFESIIEFIPKEIIQSAISVIFVNKAQIIKEKEIFEIKKDELKEGKLVYYIKEIIDLDQIEKTDTLSFNLNIPQEGLNGITGFVGFVSGNGERNIGFYLGWILAGLFTIYLAIFGIKKTKLKIWKKDESVREIYKAMQEIKRALKNKEIEKAREGYNKIKTHYVKIPAHCRKEIYKEIEKARIEIDRKDIGMLVKEFNLCVKEQRKSDALILYDKISKTYKNLPNKYRKKIYDKIMPLYNELMKKV